MFLFSFIFTKDQINVGEMANYLPLIFLNKMKKFAANLKYLRTKHGLTQANMLAKVGIKRSAWKNYETGISKPYIDDLIRIAKYFRVTETELLHVNIKKETSSQKKTTTLNKLFIKKRVNRHLKQA
jgi:transcriptional regulator with XRE-family HTH domain